MFIWQKFKYGIFDVDGTLFDNAEIMACAFLEIIAAYNLPKKEIRKIYLETNGMNLNDQFKLVFEMYKIEYDATLIEALNKKYFFLRDNWQKWQSAPLFSGTDRALKFLKNNGTKLFISTGSNTIDASFRLEKAGVSKYFSLVMGAEIIPKGPLHIVKFAQFLGISQKKFTKNAFFLSDGPNDIKLAKNAGIFAIGITNTANSKMLESAGANLVISNFTDLEKADFT